MGDTVERRPVGDGHMGCVDRQPVVAQRPQCPRQVFRRHAEERGEQAFFQGQFESGRAAAKRRLAQDIACQPFARCAQLHVLGVAHHAAIAVCQFVRDGQGKGRIGREGGAQIAGGDENHAALLDGPRRHQIGRIRHAGGQREGRHRAQHDHGVFPAIPVSDKFDQTIGHDMEEIRALALVYQRDLRRKCLMIGAAGERLEGGLADVAKQRQFADFGQTRVAHDSPFPRSA